ncbi:MAG: hypothetical protein GXX99_05110, partial [Clostridiales bacterium]|nr:hypothetical protein [Clostridiales bacterium]
MAEFLQSIWSPVLSLMLFLIIYSIGEWVTQRTKGILSTMVVASFVYIFLFVTNIIPKTSPGDTQLLQITGAFGSFLIITHLGTIIKFKDLLNEWKTVLICLSGFVGILTLCFTIGVTLFGKDYAYTAVAPISGGLVATQITAEAANAAGKADLAAFAFLVMSFQGLIGMPLASFFLKRQCDKLIAQGLHKEKIVANEITVEEDKNP